MDLSTRLLLEYLALDLAISYTCSRGFYLKIPSINPDFIPYSAENLFAYIVISL